MFKIIFIIVFFVAVLAISPVTSFVLLILFLASQYVSSKLKNNSKIMDEPSVLIERCVKLLQSPEPLSMEHEIELITIVDKIQVDRFLPDMVHDIYFIKAVIYYKLQQYDNAAVAIKLVDENYLNHEQWGDAYSLLLNELDKKT